MMVMLHTLRGQLSCALRFLLLLVPREAGDDYPPLRPFRALHQSYRGMAYKEVVKKTDRPRTDNSPS